MGELIPIQTARELRLLTGSTRALERACRRGDLIRLERGAYVAADNLAGLNDEALHLARIAAARLAADAEPVFSHESAAAIHRIPVIGDWPARVHATVRPGGTGTTAAMDRTRRTLDLGDTVTTSEGAHATSLARTAIDLAMTRSPLSGIVAISDVRRRGVALRDLEALLERCGSARGVRRARAALRRSSEQSESPLESLVLARLQDYCFELPEQQRVVEGIDGRRYRVDFAWDDGETILEADGLAKYGTITREHGSSAEQTLLEEKRREDAIRPRCRRFIRLGWSEAWAGHGLLRRLESAGVPRRDRCAALLTF